MRLYFLQVQMPDGGGPIKIGYSANFKGRANNLTWSLPWDVKLLGSCKGGATHEKKAHQTFKAYRIRGEWFSPTPEVLDGIANMIAGNFDWRAIKVKRSPHAEHNSGGDFRNCVARGWLPDLAAMLGVSKQAVFMWDTPPSHHAKKLARLRYLKPYMFKRRGEP